MDIALDPVTYDLLMPLQLVTGAAYTRQSIGIRLRFFLGEWFLDTSQGIPYYQNILKKLPAKGKAQVDSIFIDAILGAPTVNSLLSFTSTLQNRVYSAQWVANTDFGEVNGSWPG